MMSLHTFLPNWRKLNVNSLFHGVLSPSFTTVPETVCLVELISILRNFRYFNGQLFNGRPFYGHIRHERLQINMYQCFVFQFSQIFVLTGFPFFRWPYWIEDITKIQSNGLKNKTYQFEDNCAKVEYVRMPHWKTYKKSRYDVIESKFSKFEKSVISNFLLRSCGPSFIKIGQELWKWEAVTDRQTDILTHRQGSPWVNIFSPEMTEYKNERLKNATKLVELTITYISISYLPCCSYETDITL